MMVRRTRSPEMVAPMVAPMVVDVGFELPPDTTPPGPSSLEVGPNREVMVVLEVVNVGGVDVLDPDPEMKSPELKLGQPNDSEV